MTLHNTQLPALGMDTSVVSLDDVYPGTQVTVEKVDEVTGLNGVFTMLQKNGGIIGLVIVLVMASVLIWIMISKNNYEDKPAATPPKAPPKAPPPPAQQAPPKAQPTQQAPPTDANPYNAPKPPKTKEQGKKDAEAASKTWGGKTETPMGETQPVNPTVSDDEARAELAAMDDENEQEDFSDEISL